MPPKRARTTLRGALRLYERRGPRHEARQQRSGRRSAEGVLVDPRDAASAIDLLFSANPLPTWICELETHQFLEVNDAAVSCFGYSRSEFLAMTIEDIRPVDNHAGLRSSCCERDGVLGSSGSWRYRRADGSLADVEVTSHPIEWEGRSGMLVVAHDRTETQRLQDELARHLHFDEATGLGNSALFADRVSDALHRSKSEGGRVGVIVVGLGALDMVVATAGDEAADAMVRGVAEQLRSCCGGLDTLARLGGGRFAILREASDEQAILALGSAVASSLAKPVAVAGWGDLGTAGAVGVAIADDEADRAESLVRDAGSAMRHAADRGGVEFIVFNSDLRRSALDDFETEQALGVAVRRGQLQLQYQPVVGLAHGEIVACEALLRWERPGHGLVGPDRFVPLAERTDLIIELGAWVIEHAIAEASAWPSRAGLQPRVGINLSARQLRDVHLVERFASACDKFGFSSSAVCVELTESAFVATDDYDAYRNLSALREMGIEVAIDDLGTGHATLAYLKHLPIDIVKIDRFFVAGLGKDRVDALLVESMIRVAHGLGLRVAAEGVEADLQLEMLRELGCDAVQGSLVAPPVPGAGLPDSIARACRVIAR